MKLTNVSIRCTSVVVLVVYSHSVLAPLASQAQDADANDRRNQPKDSDGGGRLGDAPRRQEEREGTLGDAPRRGERPPQVSDAPRRGSESPRTPTQASRIAGSGGADAQSAVTPQSIRLPGAEGSIEGMGESFSPNLSSGTGTFSVPLAVAPGRAGVQPSLALSYASSGGNGPVGIGWGVGIPAITRQTDRGVPRYVDGEAWHAEEDRFIYNGGQELVPVSNEAARTSDRGNLALAVSVPAGLTGWQQYRARVEGGFMRFFRAPDSRRWVVQSADGTRFDFGVLPSGYPAGIDDAALNSVSSLMSEGASGTGRVFGWLLTRMSDAHGSTVYYRYREVGGARYIRDIHYVSPSTCERGTASAPLVEAQRDCTEPLAKFGARVAFDYEPRSDVFASYVSGWRVEGSERLKRVTMTAADADVGTRYLVRRYHLAYDVSSFHSLLASVAVEGRVAAPDEYGAMVRSLTTEAALTDDVIGQTMAPMTFRYSSPSTTGPVVPGFGGIDATVHAVQSSPSVSLGGEDAELYDVNGDGLSDLVVTNPGVYRTANNQPAVGVFFNGFSGVNAAPAGRTAAFSEPVPVPMAPNRASQMRFSSVSALAMDVNGDGAGDLLHFPRLTQYGYFTPARTVFGSVRSPAEQGWRWVHAAVSLTQGVDPLVDLARDGTYYRFLDVNNDHLTDIVRTAGTELQTWMNLGWVPGGDGQFGQATWSGSAWSISTAPIRTCLPHDGSPLDFSVGEIRLADMNGDGLDDIVRLSPTSITYWAGRGGAVFGDGPAQCNAGTYGTNRHVVFASPPQGLNVSQNGIFLSDLNGDGAADVLQLGAGALDVWFNRAGRSFTSRITVTVPYSAPFKNNIAFSDIDGSGTTDLVYGQGGQWTYLDLLGGTRPRLLVGVDNGLGATTTLEYGTSAQDYVRDLAASSACSGANCPSFTWDAVTGTACDAQLQARSGECVRPAGGAPLISHVVRAVSTTDNFDELGLTPNVTRTEYAYHNAYYEGIEQEFRGFGVTDVHVLGDANAPSVWSRTWMHQGRRESAIATDRLAESWDEALKGRTYLSETFDETGRYASSSAARVTVRRLMQGLDGRFVTFAYVSQQDDFTYDTSEVVPEGVEIPLTLVTRETVNASGVPVSEGTQPAVTVIRLRGARFRWTRTRTPLVTNLGQVLRTEAHGRVHDEDDPGVAEHDYHEKVISETTVAAIGTHPSGWLFRPTTAAVLDATGFRFGETTSAYDALGRLTETSRVARLQQNPGDPLPGVPSNGRYVFGGDSSAPGYTPTDQTQVSSMRYDRWGQVTSTCAGATSAQPTSACLRYGEVTRDAEYAQLTETESAAVGDSGLPGSPFALLTTSGTWDRGNATVLSVTDANGVEATVTYDGFGRLTSATPPNTATCQMDGPTTVVTYHTRVTNGPPVSFVEIVSDARAPSGADDCATELKSTARSYIDGLGRARAALASYPDPSSAGLRWVRSGVASLTAKGSPHCAYDADVVEGEALTDILSVPDSATICAEADAFARPVMTTERDGSRSRILYTASSQTVYDPLDLDPNADLHHRDTPSTTRVDGHGRVIDQVLRLRQPGETHTSYIRLFTRYRADGAVISVRRAETESAARNATVVPGHEVTRNFAYDTVGNRIGHTDADSDNPADASDTTRHWRYLYNRLGELAAVRDPRGCGQDFFYDRAGRLIAEDYIGCGEAQASGDLTDETVPAGSMGYDTVPSGRQADVRYFFDTFPAWAEGADTSLPANRGAYSLGRATGSSDRAQRSAIVYDARGQAVWAARQMALLPEAAELDVTTFNTALPAFPNETATQATRVWDEVNTYVSTSRYDNAGRGIGIELPSDPDWMLYGDATDPETPPTVGGAMEFDERGLPTEASLVVEGIATRVVSLTYDHFGRVTDTEIGNEDHGNRTHVDYDVRHRPVQARFKRELTDASADPDDVLPRVRYPYWYLYTWDAANNLTRITDQGGYANSAFQDGYRQRTVHVTHDSLYRVAQVDFTYRAQNGQWGPHDAATDWRAQRTRVNADGRTHRDADPMDREPVRMASEMPAERVQNITYAYDWLTNMTEWKDDANAFYERSIGDVGNGAGHANARPSALYVATNISYDEPSPDPLADRGGYVEVQYGAGGNVTSFTVHGQCRDASPTNVCFAEDVQASSPDAVVASLRARCACDAATEQHVQLRWDELNRLVEARRYDRESGQWDIAVRQRHVYDGGNARMVKETIDVDQADPTLRQRIALGVIPGDFDRVGVYADHSALEPAYKGAAELNSETQYSVAGARMVRARGEEAGALKARRRLTYALADLIQSTSAVIDLDSGELLETGTFYPNGARETHRASSKSPVPLDEIGFTGKEEDEEVGLTYFGERWLIPRLGRWASPDPLAVHAGGGGEFANGFHYVGGDALQARDPQGLQPATTAGAQRTIPTTPAPAATSGGTVDEGNHDRPPMDSALAAQIYLLGYDVGCAQINADFWNRVFSGEMGGGGHPLYPDITYSGMREGMRYYEDRGLLTYSGLPDSFAPTYWASSLRTWIEGDAEYSALFQRGYDSAYVERNLNTDAALLSMATGGAGVAGSGAGINVRAALASLRHLVARAAPHGFNTIEAFQRFANRLNSGLSATGVDDSIALLQGSAVTGRNFRTGRPFDGGPALSDFDIAIASPTLLARARAAGVETRSGGTRTGPLNDRAIRALGLEPLRQSLSQMAGRPVNFMIYESATQAANRSSSILLR